MDETRDMKIFEYIFKINNMMDSVITVGFNIDKCEFEEIPKIILVCTFEHLNISAFRRILINLILLKNIGPVDQNLQGR